MSLTTGRTLEESHALGLHPNNKWDRCASCQREQHGSIPTAIPLAVIDGALGIILRNGVPMVVPPKKP